MTATELIDRLRRVTPSEGLCLGCGHEHDCGTRGRAVMQALADFIEAQASALTEV